MAAIQTRIIAITLESCEITCPPDLNPLPGQYFIAAARDGTESLPAVLYPAARGGETIIIGRPFPETWRVGTVLNLRGPLGRGFHFPTAVRRVALVSAGSYHSSLFEYQIGSIIKRGGEVAYYGAIPAAGLSLEVEGLPLEQAGEAWRWAEYLAADVDLANLGLLLRVLSETPDARLPDQAEVLIRTNMPCGGLAECGLCAIKTVRGYRLACKDGPVFPLAELSAALASAPEEKS